MKLRDLQALQDALERIHKGPHIQYFLRVDRKGTHPRSEIFATRTSLVKVNSELLSNPLDVPTRNSKHRTI